MRNEAGEGDYGPALYRYFQMFWEADGSTATRWAHEHGIPSPQMTRWKQGQAPSADYLRRAAEVTGRPVVDVLVAVGLLPSEQVGGHVVIPPETRSPHPAPISALIEVASDLADGERQPVRDAVELVLRAMRGGPGGKAEF